MSRVEKTDLQQELTCCQEEMHKLHKLRGLLTEELRACSLVVGVKIDEPGRNYTDVSKYVKDRLTKDADEYHELQGQLESCEQQLSDRIFEIRRLDPAQKVRPMEEAPQDGTVFEVIRERPEPVLVKFVQYKNKFQTVDGYESPHDAEGWIPYSSSKVSERMEKSMEHKPTKWEYLTNSFDLSKDWGEQLNWQGHSDWELVQILTTSIEPNLDHRAAVFAIFKRPVLGDAAVGERPDHDENPS